MEIVLSDAYFGNLFDSRMLSKNYSMGSEEEVEYQDTGSRTVIFLFEYVGTRRGIYAVNADYVHAVVPATAIVVNDPSDIHSLYIKDGAVMFKSSGWSGVIRFRRLSVL